MSRFNISQLPVGMIFPVLNQNTAPPGTLECDGSSISQTTYSELFSGNPLSIGTYYNPTPIAGQFSLPDIRGRVMRHTDHGAGIDPDAATRTSDHVGGPSGDKVGSMQNDLSKIPAHNHLGGVQTTGPGFVVDAYGNVFVGGPPTTGNYVLAPVNNKYQHFTSTVAASGNETRMKNFNGMWVIKY